jgi:alpha-L-fucosidase
LQDTVVTNDRWGSGTQCKHGDFYTCADRYICPRPRAPSNIS